MSPPVVDAAEAVQRASSLAASGQRRLLGIVGPPGAGKTTLAEQVVAAVGSAAMVPMDGFHLADVQLRRLGRLERKGASDTFDAWGYLALLRRLRAGENNVVYAPGFERTLEQPIAGSIAVDPSTCLVVTEGNYLLLEAAPWTDIAATLDEVWWVETDAGERDRRLVKRHIEFGKEPDFAKQWVHDVDDANARTIDPGRDRADLIVRTDSPLSPTPAAPEG